MPLNYHQEVVEIVRHAAREPTDRFHFLRLAKLLLEDVPLADVLRHNQANSLAGILQLMNRGLDFDDLSIFLSMLPMATIEPVAAVLCQVNEHLGPVFFGPKIQNGHSLEFFLRIAVLTDGRFVDFEKTQ